MCSSVTLIHRRDELRANKLAQSRALANEKLHILYDTVVDEIVGDEKVTQLKIAQQKKPMKPASWISTVYLSLLVICLTMHFYRQNWKSTNRDISLPTKKWLLIFRGYLQWAMYARKNCVRLLQLSVTAAQ